MRIVFLGNGPFAVPTLRALVAQGRRPIRVVARPDRPHGKPRQVQAGPVKQCALEAGLAVWQPEDINAPAAVAELVPCAADLLVVADFGQLLSRDCLEAARWGGINVHASLLPKYRGAAPVNWAILNGETETGVSIIRLAAQLDAGAILAQAKIPIGPATTAPQLEAELAQLGARLALEVVARYEAGPVVGDPQAAAGVTRAPKLKKEDGIICWERSAQQIHDQVRGLLPWPTAYTHWLKQNHQTVRIQLLESAVAEAPEEPGAPGTVVRAAGSDLWVRAGAGILRIIRLKAEGKAELAAADFLRGNRIMTGDRFAARG